MEFLKAIFGDKYEEFASIIKAYNDNPENKIAEMKFGTLIDNAISAAGGKNAKAIRALLDVETLKDSKNQTEDITAAIEACKKDNEYMFGSNEPINNPIAPTGGKVPGVSKNLEDMTYEEYKDYRQGK